MESARGVDPYEDLCLVRLGGGCPVLKVNGLTYLQPNKPCNSNKRDLKTCPPHKNWKTTQANTKRKLK